jgi:3-methyladenine DNA glycosylase/8-oxoguanine DNA glycosylase
MAGNHCSARVVPLEAPIDLLATLGPVRRGSADPCVSLTARVLWRASRTPDGPVLLHLAHSSPDRIDARAFGPGHRWAIEHVPDLVGLGDDPSAFTRLLSRVDTPEQPLLARLHRAHPGLRIPRTLALAESLTPVVLEQRVNGLEARRQYRRLVLAHGDPAPAGPREAPALRLPPAPEVLSTLPSWRYHRHGIETRRADTIVRVNTLAEQLDRATDDPHGDPRRLLRSINGIGPWSVAEVARSALGDADGVSVGDFHLPHQVAWAFRGVARSDDATMLELLAPYAGQRGRVIRLLMLAGVRAPARGPRQPILDIRVR